jgi:hypothetical protein
MWSQNLRNRVQLASPELGILLPSSGPVALNFRQMRWCHSAACVTFIIAALGSILFFFVAQYFIVCVHHSAFPHSALGMPWTISYFRPVLQEHPLISVCLSFPFSRVHFHRCRCYSRRPWTLCWGLGLHFWGCIRWVAGFFRIAASTCWVELLMTVKCLLPLWPPSAHSPLCLTAGFGPPMHVAGFACDLLLFFFSSIFPLYLLSF